MIYSTRQINSVRLSISQHLAFVHEPKIKLNVFLQKKIEKIAFRYTIKEGSGNQIIENQLQLLVTLHCFKKVLPT